MTGQDSQPGAPKGSPGPGGWAGLAPCVKTERQEAGPKQGPTAHGRPGGRVHGNPSLWVADCLSSRVPHPTITIRQRGGDPARACVRRHAYECTHTHTHIHSHTYALAHAHATRLTRARTHTPRSPDRVPPGTCGRPCMYGTSILALDVPYHPPLPHSYVSRGEEQPVPTPAHRPRGLGANDCVLNLPQPAKTGCR